MNVVDLVYYFSDLYFKLFNQVFIVFFLFHTRFRVRHATNEVALHFKNRIEQCFYIIFVPVGCIFVQ